MTIERSKSLDEVIKKYEQREAVGLKKYGTTVDREDLTPEEWAIHLQEELMDATLYIQRLIEKIKQHDLHN